MPPAPHVDLLHADASLIVVDKPPGLLAVQGRGEAGRDNLAARVQALFADALVVHRIDMATSGLMLFARGAAMQRQLSMAFARGEVAKQYVAVVYGEVQGEAGTIAAALAADWPNRPRQVVDPVHGKPSLTRWRVLSRGDGQTRLGLEPLTGRTHQLRVHLAHLGHAIEGDVLYGEDEACYLAFTAHLKQGGDPRWPAGRKAGRQLLHAQQLALRHPRSGAALVLEATPPAEFLAALAALGPRH